jgi:23S rRNA C2498 (ribose-2'-O)-methylase RlmM
MATELTYNCKTCNKKVTNKIERWFDNGVCIKTQFSFPISCRHNKVQNGLAYFDPHYEQKSQCPAVSEYVRMVGK